MSDSRVSRRAFVKATSSALVAGPLACVAQAAQQKKNHTVDSDEDVSLDGRIFKTLKIGMVQLEGSLTDKFIAAKAAGFNGIEMNSPGMDVEETRTAIKESGLPVNGTVCSTHWKIRHTSPKADVRAQALKNLHWKYGNTGDWIRTLGRRVVKLDLKGFSRAQSTFTKIGEGDIDWADVRKALVEIKLGCSRSRQRRSESLERNLC